MASFAPGGRIDAVHKGSGECRVRSGLDVAVDLWGVRGLDIRWVSTITVRSQDGSTSQDAPRPPSQPNAPLS
jgi:hypothetical protein